MTRLVAAHPLIFRGQEPALSSHLPPGWYALVDELCFAIERQLPAEYTDQFEVRQIKEKFGEFRFYFRIGEQGDLHTDIQGSGELIHLVTPSLNVVEEIERAESLLRDLVRAACEKSATTCEACGARARLRRSNGYLSTLCDAHMPAKTGRLAE